MDSSNSSPSSAWRRAVLPEALGGHINFDVLLILEKFRRSPTRWFVLVCEQPFRRFLAVFVRKLDKHVPRCLAGGVPHKLVGMRRDRLQVGVLVAGVRVTDHD